MSSLYETLRTILAEKASELFVDYGVTPSDATGDPSTESQLCGILGFTGDRLCGSVMISATKEAVACSNPIGDGATRSWVAELTNQLVGRFKNALLRGGIEVAMSVPVVLTATQLTPMPQVEVKPIRMAVGPGLVTIWLEIEADPEVVLAEPSPDAGVPAEGEAFLF